MYLWIWASESNGHTGEVDPPGDTYRSPIVRFHLEGTFEIGPSAAPILRKSRLITHNLTLDVVAAERRRPGRPRKYPLRERRVSKRVREMNDKANEEEEEEFQEEVEPPVEEMDHEQEEGLEGFEEEPDEEREEEEFPEEGELANDDDDYHGSVHLFSRFSLNTEETIVKK